jgi:hypothetical protein
MILDEKTGEMMEKTSLPVLLVHPADVARFERDGLSLAGYDVRQFQRIPVPPAAPRVLTGQPQGPARSRNARRAV